MGVRGRRSLRASFHDLDVVSQTVASSSRPYTCDKCTRVFTKTGDLKNHKPLHWTKEEREKVMYKCPKCPRIMLRRSELRHHINRSHKKIVCSEVNCTFTTTRPASMRWHKTSHCNAPDLCVERQCTPTSNDLGSGTVLPPRMFPATPQHQLSPDPSTSATTCGSVFGCSNSSSTPNHTTLCPSSYLPTLSNTPLPCSSASLLQLPAELFIVGPRKYRLPPIIDAY
ncbi:uncharacterized protein BT62DRAFT_1079877 [Guyanagaster necrorhizus]|uniref:C2H2-type domain-containing protein n=1 Tax=Guyanagaster necrorhizus TaxID=856835 RepID=A0A9P8ANB4_9AGAR|nr:uncharacterized protein BT62DRAFT_1079877 [Guyanagaster necrorhizus MCA 3950]KAG7441710.1 hypothetical protein BT62DRAFT_1079877 [Guyanagaster necrorhizus MCA 3950]